MRVVLDSRYVRRRPSGIGRYVEALVERLPALAPDLDFHFWAHPERPDIGRGQNATRQTVRAPADGLRTLLCPSVLGELRRDDVVHFPFSLLGRGLRATAVVTICDVMWLEQPAWVDARPLLRRVRQPFYQAGMRWAIRHASHICTISRATADRVVAIDPSAAARVHVTHLAASEDFRPAGDADAARARAASLVGESGSYFLVLGKNEPYKAHDLAVRAFAAAAGPHDKLVLVQRESSGRGLDRLVRELSLGERVRWLPSLAQGELLTLLQGATALLQPSLVEGFGLPALEAMASGCPVIASDDPALVEVCGGAALHAARGRVDELAAAIRKLGDAGLRDELGQRGVERARDFHWDRTAKATVEVYRHAGARRA